MSAVSKVQEVAEVPLYPMRSSIDKMDDAFGLCSYSAGFTTLQRGVDSLFTATHQYAFLLGIDGFLESVHSDGQPLCSP